MKSFLRALAVVGMATLAPTIAGAQAAALVSPADWAGYRDHFILPDGRLADDGNGGVSHSEGQGYSMLLAALADDRATFARLWAWTTRELEVRGDSLAAWRWRPQDDPHVMDRNNATDGDLLLAWALAEASERWSSAEYKAASRRIALSIARSVVTFTPAGHVLMPGTAGFSAAERADGPVVNLSYWVFPALDKLARVAPEVDWKPVRASGLALAAAAASNAAELPPDWVSLKAAPAPADKFPPNFGYDAVRVPLYLAWASGDQTALLRRFVDVWARSGDPRPHVVDVTTGASVEPFYDPGYRAVVALARCAVVGDPFPADLKSVAFTSYYSSTLHLLSLAAARQRFAQCV